MSVRAFLKTIHVALVEGQKQLPEPDRRIARVITVIEHELQHLDLCPTCGLQRRVG